MPLPCYVSPEQMQGEAQPQASRTHSKSQPGGPA